MPVLSSFGIPSEVKDYDLPLVAATIDVKKKYFNILIYFALIKILRISGRNVK